VQIAEQIQKNVLSLLEYIIRAHIQCSVIYYIKVKVKQSRYRPELAQRVDRGIALPFRDLSARRG
jgi:hypothetical protein